MKKHGKLDGPLSAFHTKYKGLTLLPCCLSLTRFIAGTDWPFMHCEVLPKTASILNWLRKLLPEASDWKKVAVENPHTLFSR